jgi:hypothetical protein
MKRFVVSVLLAAMTAGVAVAPVLAQGDNDPRNTRVTLELTNTPVRAAIQALFRFVPFNYTIGTNVDGMISVSLNDVPFEVALSPSRASTSRSWCSAGLREMSTRLT